MELDQKNGRLVRILTEQFPLEMLPLAKLFEKIFF